MSRVLLMTTLTLAGQKPEAEPVVVETDHSHVSLLLDDGSSVTFDRDELAAALEQPAQRSEAA